MRQFTSLLILAAFTLSCMKEKRSDKAAESMQDFVISISKYAKGIDPDFIIIPQNGVELAFNYLDTIEGLNTEYMTAIDGMGVEELFYNGSYELDNERLTMLRIVSATKKIMVAESVSDNANITDAGNRNYNEGFICFVRNSSNYDYLQIPDAVTNENATDITSLSMAQNYLYLISTDNFAVKEDMISAMAATNFDVIIMDLFFNETELSASDINQLKTKANGGKRLVVSYINVGAAEKFRYYWKKGWGAHHPLWLKKRYEGYRDEFWVKYWKDDWKNIIYGNDDSYMKKILNAGFDGAYLDNVEAYYFLYFKD